MLSTVSIVVAVFVGLLGVVVIAEMGFFGGNQFPVNGRTVLITGGSQGMGLSVASQLAKKGANIVIVARNVEKLKKAISQIQTFATSSSKQRFHFISADLTSASECSRVLDETRSWNSGHPPDIVWCCAGNSSPTLFADTKVETLDSMMSANYFTAAYTAHAALRAWIATAKSTSVAATAKEPPKHIIFTSSFLGLFPIAGYSPYSPAKTALRSLSDTLSMECKLYEASLRLYVKSHVAFPATIFGEAFDEENKVKSDLTKKLEESDEGQTADVVARQCIAALERGDELVSTAFLTKLVMASTLGGSRRSGWGILDALMALLMVFVMPFVRSDLDGKTHKFGKLHGSSGFKDP